MLAPPSGKATTTLSASTLDRAGTDAATTLPVDVHYDVKGLAKLFLKSQWVVPLKHRAKRPRTQQGGYAYENPNDSRNFVSDDRETGADGPAGGPLAFGHDDDDDDEVCVCE